MDQQLEALLKRGDYGRKVVKVLQVERRSGSAEGENHLSRIDKLKVSVLLGSGRKTDLNLIMKIVPEGSNAKAFINERGVFKQEVMIYTKMLKEMENVMTQFGDKRDKLWCDLVGYEPYETIVFPDLTAEGFVVTDRTKCQDLKHSLLVVEALGRFHAMSRVILDRGIVSPTDLNPHIFADPSEYEKLWGCLTPVVGNEIKNWGHEWVEVGEKLSRLKFELSEQMSEAYQVDEGRFNVVNHGDCWTCNLMFKHDASGEPISLRFIDFQCCYYNSVGWDLTYFMTTSVLPSVRRENEEILLERYIHVLNESLNLYKYEGPRLDMAALKLEMKRLQVLKLILLLSTHPIMTSDLKDAFTFEYNKGEPPINLKLFRGERGAALNNSIGPDFLHFVETGIIS